MVEENKPDGMDTDKADPYANDPFFKGIFDGQWNACIGRQGHEENYIDGYIEAAIELPDALSISNWSEAAIRSSYRSFTMHGTQSN